MAANGKPTSQSAPQTAYNSVVGLLGEWVRQGSEGFIATQKILLDLAAQQNALALTIVRERLGFATPRSKALADMTVKGIKNFMAAQQILLDIVAKQNAIVAEGLKPGVKGTPAEGLAEVVHQSMENFVAAQKELLGIFEAQAEGAVNDWGDGKCFESRRISELARDETRSFLESQKKYLDILEEQLTVKREAGMEAANGDQRVDIFDMVKKTVDTFIDAQQRLLDLVSDQIEADVKFARELFDTEARPITTLSDLMKKSVDSFVAAQKALVDLASKPRKPAEPAAKPECGIVIAAS
jgi:hypothetical protein